MRPAFRSLFEAAVAAGEVGEDVDADEFLNAAAALCSSVPSDDPALAERLIALLVQGVRRYR